FCSMQEKHPYELIARAIRFVTNNYRAQPSLDDIAAHVHLSKYHFQRLFQTWVGVSPKQFLQCITLEHAKKHLAAGRTTLDTAYEIGLSGNGRLHDLFVKIEARSPGDFQRKGTALTIIYRIIPSAFGPALVAETSRGICQVVFLEEHEKPKLLLKSIFPKATIVEGEGVFIPCVAVFFENWIAPTQKVPLDLKGTPFQISVWRALLTIPTGKVVAYGDIAKQIGKPMAVRAVGTAIGKNPIAYLIPCHRVIRESGELGGYRWGTERKRIINSYETIKRTNR
ncbi:MAG: methylated-DNA--[protein]-cysteine S-methyltransferase, partial [Bacteroidota bacterium]